MMCIPSTIYDLDFRETALEGDDLTDYVRSYATRVLDEAWRMDCYENEATSTGNNARFQRCALRALKEKLGDGINGLHLPDIRMAGMNAGKRVGKWSGGFPC